MSRSQITTTNFPKITIFIYLLSYIAMIFGMYCRPCFVLKTLKNKKNDLVFTIDTQVDIKKKPLGHVPLQVVDMILDVFESDILHLLMVPNIV